MRQGGLENSMKTFLCLCLLLFHPTPHGEYKKNQTSQTVKKREDGGEKKDVILLF